MYAEMTCKCDAHFSIESDEDNSESLWGLVWRFANAHISCGYITQSKPAEEDEYIVNSGPTKRSKYVDDEEYEEEE